MTSTSHPFVRGTVKPSTVKPAQNAGTAKPEQKEQNAAKPANVRRTPVTHKDLTILYMMNGIDAITSVLNESGDPVGSLDKIIATLTENEKDTTELVSLRDFYAQMRNLGQPGRAPVKIGDKRDYSVQQSGEEGDFFVRIPVNTLQVQRGNKLRAEFFTDRIVLMLTE